MTVYEKILEHLIRDALPKAKHITVGGDNIADGNCSLEIEYFNKKDFDILQYNFFAKDFCISNSAEESGYILVEFMLGKTYDNLQETKNVEVKQ